MKKGILIICLFATSHCYGQQMRRYFAASDSNNIMAMQDSIMALLPTYRFSGTDSGYANASKIYARFFANDANESISIQYSVSGNRIYDIHLYGPFTSLFAIWKKYFNPAADSVRIKKFHETIKTDGYYNFTRSNGDWTIFCAMYYKKE